MNENDRMLKVMKLIKLMKGCTQAEAHHMNGQGLSSIWLGFMKGGGPIWGKDRLYIRNKVSKMFNLCRISMVWYVMFDF